MLLKLGCLLLIFSGLSFADKAKQRDMQAKSALDLYVEQAHRRAMAAMSQSPGSLWSGFAPLADAATDIRARSIDDIVTILVTDQANAVSTGTTKTQRTSSANASITALAGLSASGPLANLANTSGNTQLNGQGTTSRQTTLSTTLSARVVDVLPNGYLVVEGTKTVLVNSENQVVTIRGVVRPADLSTGNIVRSDNVAQMELRINGRGVVNDSIKRPSFLYRILLGLLPF